MSILIKGMKMPTGCAICKIKRRNGKKMVCPLCNEEWDIRDPMSAYFRLDLCPLGPVPPHGRLIEENKVLDIVFEWCPDDDGSVGKVGDVREMLDEIEALPTIIEAEEDE